MDAEIPTLKTQPAGEALAGSMPGLVLALAQINPTVGDMAGNVVLMVEAARQAHAAGATLVAFPELSVTGYYPGDLLQEPEFQANVTRAYERLLEASVATPGMYWVIGLPYQGRPNSPQAVSSPLHNGLAVIRDGELLARYAKQLLPTYGVFNERRHFEPGPGQPLVMDIGAVRVGFLVCEDAWNEAGTLYRDNPFAQLEDEGAQLAISINASPSQIGKRDERHELFAQACRRRGMSVAYVNQVGGQDQLVYDGASFVANARGVIQAEGARFEPDLLLARFSLQDRGFVDDAGAPLPAVPAPGLGKYEFYRRQIVLGLRDYARRCGFRQVVVGSSGGLDSAVTLALAAEALGPENVLAITLPSIFSSAGSVDDSKTLCENLGVRLDEVAIAPMVDAFVAQMKDSSLALQAQGLTLENLQARVRGTLLMAVSNARGYMLLNTGNKSELAVGYCTLYGDTNGGLGLLGDLYKTEVFELARHINEAVGRELVPLAIIDKPPSAELAPGQRDDDSLPPYPVLDAVLKLLLEPGFLAADEREEAAATVSQLEVTDEGRALIARVRELIARSEYKRFQAPPVIRVRGRAFGSGRQLPIAAIHHQELT